MTTGEKSFEIKYTVDGSTEVMKSYYTAYSKYAAKKKFNHETVQDVKIIGIRELAGNE